jgi:hypothetical protein
MFFPSHAQDARRKLAEWQVRAAEVRVEAGTAGPEVVARLQTLKEQSPELRMQIGRVERAETRAEEERDWRALRVADIVAVEKPEAHLAAVRKFLRDYPDTAHREEAVALAGALADRVAERHSLEDRATIDAIARAELLPETPVRDLIERAEAFLAERPESLYRGEVEEMLGRFLRRLDEADIARARQFAKANPTNFAARREKYLDYLKAHAEGGRFVAEANSALDAIERERDVYLYRQAYDHYAAHRDDVPAIAARLRDYLDANPQGRYADAARVYVRWWEKISEPGEYRVVLRRGSVDPGVGKWFSGAGPDLSVKVWVGGLEYGPSPVVRDTRRPIWDWTFPRKVRWKYGDPVSIRILDNDWSSSGVFTLNTPAGDKLAMRMLSGSVRPSKGGQTELVFSSDFREATLPEPK